MHSASSRPSCPRWFPLLLALSVAAPVAPAAATPRLTPELVAQLPAPVERRIDFARDIQPIFEASCVQCHARGKSKGNFSLETRADWILGGDAGAPAVAGRSAESLVVALVAGIPPEDIMPKKGKHLTRDQIAVLRAWIDQGMAWPAEITFFRHEPANLRPRDEVPLPAAPGFSHPVDRLVAAYFKSHDIAWARPVDDRTYTRRVWLDTVGLLPTPAELAAFAADPAPDKRARLVARLLGDTQNYAEHWLTFWNDLLRNDYKGPGYTDGGRKQITSWIYSALARNLPYDQFVAQLVDPGAESEGFANGIIWRGAVNASMVPPMQAAQGIAQVFLGVNLKCASCHDSFINEYSLADSYGLASIYSDGPLEVAECDRPTGQIAKVKFLYAELGSLETATTPAARKQQLAALLTGRTNGRLPRTVVNRLWRRFLGRGLVEPVDEMDRPAWAPALLDWLAEDLVAHGYDLKHTMARILTSHAYQLPTYDPPAPTEDYVFRGPALRRLEAEQFSDAVHRLGGLTRPKADAKLNRAAALHPAPEALPLSPRWIWGAAGGQARTPPATYIFRRTVTLAAAPTAAHFAICADDNYAIKINGRNAGSSGRRNSTATDWIDVRASLRAGDNLIEITVINMPPDEGRLVSVKTDALPDPNSPAGLLLYARVRIGDIVADFVSDSHWSTLAFPAPPTTERFRPPDPRGPEPRGPAVELGGVDLAPWKVGAHFLAVAAADRDTLPVQRASLVNADPLMTALGRPNREQVTTARQTTATTLQALELTNGGTLAKLLQESAAKILADRPTSGSSLIDSLYRQALGRPPLAAEHAIATEILGAALTAAGIEDLLWTLVMLPEFQLIH